jgi:hypothetical protein
MARSLARAVVILIGVSSPLWAAARDLPRVSEVVFRHVILDDAGPVNPYLKTAGDLNGDGRIDLIVGGNVSGGLVWYENPSWKKHVIDPGAGFNTDAEVADVDGDGKPDIICVTNSEVRWYRNPDWQMTVIGKCTLHDIEVADFDGDGKIDLVGRDQAEFGRRGDRLHFYKQDSPGAWRHRELEIPNGEGLCVADVDGDGKPDVVIQGSWLANPGDILRGQWTAHAYTKTWTHRDAFIAVGDVNGDRRPDIVLAPSELAGGKYRISWFESPPDPTREGWTEHVVEDGVETVHHFVGVADMNNDGAADIVSAAMHQGKAPQEVKIYFNQGKGLSWKKQVVATTGSHSMRIVDLANDGRKSLFGANHQGQKIELWENRPPRPPRAARSVHLGYPAPEAAAFYNELTVEKSVPGSYFMACGFSHGYFGIQEQGKGRKVVIFSVWDPAKGDNPNAVPDAERVEVLYKADDVVARRFGGEGTGGQSFYQYDWKIGETYRFLVKASVAEKKTAFTAYFFLPESKTWKHLVTFRTATGGDRLKGLYSFIEDFRRDTKSAAEVRRAVFGNGWVRDAKGQWTPLARARFTASGATWEAKETIDAGVVKDRFYLQTGGDTKTSTRLGTRIERPAGSGTPPQVPAD